MKTFLIPQRSLTASYEAEIVVCGGGTAGVFAALSAAESGKRVLLVEQFGSLGGSASNALVMPLMHSHIDGDPACSYLSLRLRQKLLDHGSLGDEGRSFDPTVLKLVLEELCAEAGVQILYHTFLSDVLTEQGVIKALVAVNKAGTIVIAGDFFIDCTGDGDVSVLAGADFTRGHPETGQNQPTSLRYLVSGIDLPALGRFLNREVARTGIENACFYHPPYTVYGACCEGRFTLSDLFDRAVAAGDLTEGDRVYWQMFSVPGRTDSVAFNNPEFYEFRGGTDPDVLTNVQLNGKKAIFRQLAFYKKYMEGFEHAYISEIAPMVGVRESRSIRTEYVLTLSDLLSRRKFEDAFCQSAYPVDIHGYSIEFVSRYKPADDDRPYYEVPYRCLVVRGFENLLVAGRCLGADFLAQASLRIQPTCRSSGEAAGIAASLALDAGIPARELDGRQEMTGDRARSALPPTPYRKTAPEAHRGRFLFLDEFTQQLDFHALIPQRIVKIRILCYFFVNILDIFLKLLYICSYSS